MRGAYCPSPMLLFYISPCRKTFPAWRNVIYQHGRGKKCSGTNRVFSHSQKCNFPDESFVLSTCCNSVERDLLHSPMPEKSSAPWRETFYIPPCQKSLPLPGARSFTFRHARKVFRSLEQDLLRSPMPEKSSSLWSEIFYRKKLVLYKADHCISPPVHTLVCM